MSNRPLMILGAVAVVLLLAYFLLSRMDRSELSPYVGNNFVGLDSGMVNRITVSRLGGIVEFQRTGDGWNVVDNGTPRRAERGVIDNIANIAHDLTVGEIISSNPEKQMLFEADTLLGRTVRFYRETQELAAVIVGKAGSDFRSSYVRKPDSKDVYLAATPISRLLERPASGYRDRAIHALDTAQIMSIRIQSGDLNYQIARVDSLWMINDAKGTSVPASSAKIGPLVSQLATLRISEFVSPADAQAVSFGEKSDRVSIGLRDGAAIQVVLQMKDETSKNYYLRSTVDNEVYSVYEHVRSSIVKKPEEWM